MKLVLASLIRLVLTVCRMWRPNISSILTQVCHVVSSTHHIFLHCPEFSLHFVIFTPDASIVFLRAVNNMVLL